MMYHYKQVKAPMPKKKAKVDGWRDFLNLCNAFSSPLELNQFCNLFFTIEEKRILASRYLIIKALLEGKMTQREIARTYNVSIAQITRGSNALKIIGPKLKKLLIKLLEESIKDVQ